ncbi:MAG TPA: SLBB domain-containing protein [Acidobacteriaceae bacterium]|nr:SLBB domain-containing protein [Acidobacteriaceae bacterium]
MRQRDENSELRRSPWALRLLSAGVVAMTLFGAAPLSLHAQENSIAAPPALQTGPDGLGALDSSGSRAGQANDARVFEGSASATDSAIQPLTAAQIFAILEQNPEAVIEVKSLLADKLAQQGIPLAPDAITDDVLYSQIGQNRDVRASITLFLRARGYLTAAALQAPSSGAAAMDATTSMMQMSSLSSPDESSLTSPFAGNSGASPYGPGASPSMNRAAASPSTTAARQAGITDPPAVLRVPTPYNLLSLRDLYTQVPASTEHLKRFGSDVFVDRSFGAGSRLGAVGAAPALDVPAGPDYVVGPGDALIVNMWGGVSQSLTRVIDRDGKVMLPEAGDVHVAGMPMEQAQAAITHALQQQFRNVQVSVSLARLRSIRVYVVGDVQRPGAYDISSLSSPLSALYAAGGPTATGSLRTLRHYRGRELVGEVDLYDFLLHGIRSGDDRLQGGDTLLVPPAGAQVAVAGAVRRPAIYELKDEKTLSQVLGDAGGTTVDAALGHITVERIDAHQHRETTTLDLDPPGDPPNDPPGDPVVAHADLTHFTVQDGDRIEVAPIVPWSERVVYLEGHVVRPGRTAFHDGMHLSDVLHSYRDLLPEPADRAEIVRLVPPDLHPEAIEFEVPDALVGNENPTLQPFDTVRIFGRYETDAPQVTVNGEVLHPGAYPLGAGMTAADLVRMAGGFRRDADLNDADLMSYHVENGKQIAGLRASIRIGDAVTKRDRNSDVALHAGDVLTIHQITGWADIGATITIEGEVGHPGVYGFREGEHLSDLLRRAGGLRDTAYPEGAVLTREEVRTLEEKSRAELIRQIETSSAAARLSPSVGGKDASGTLQLIQAQETQVLSDLRSEPPNGRMVIHIGADIASWAGTPADIEVRKGDVLRIPKRPGFVLVSGQVYNASAITFTPGKSAGWYLTRAGGATSAANRREIFIIRANGSVVGRGGEAWYGRGVLATQLYPGDVIVVPQKIIGASLFWRNLLSGAQVASSIAVAAAVATL